MYPTAIISNQSVDCNICREQTCKFVDKSLLKPEFKPYNGDVPNGPYNGWWVKKYCTFNSKEGIDEFILYFPYILLIIPLGMILIEHCFVRYITLFQNVFTKKLYI